MLRAGKRTANMGQISIGENPKFSNGSSMSGCWRQAGFVMFDWLDDETLQRLRDILPRKVQRFITACIGLSSWVYVVCAFFLKLTDG